MIAVDLAAAYGRAMRRPAGTRWHELQILDRESRGEAANSCVFARARPEDKLRIVRAATEAGQVVAVTAD